MGARFDGKVVLITGGAGVIAGATAQAFTDLGATVVLAGHNAGTLAEAAARIPSSAGTVDSIVADVMAANIGAHGRRPGMAAYAASKAAVSVLTRTAARDHIADCVRINAVSPGAADTPMSFRPNETRADRDARISAAVPAGRVGTPAEIAAAVLWLASEESGFMVGHDLVIDGGATA